MKASVFFVIRHGKQVVCRKRNMFVFGFGKVMVEVMKRECKRNVNMK